MYDSVKERNTPTLEIKAHGIIILPPDKTSVGVFIYGDTFSEICYLWCIIVLIRKILKNRPIFFVSFRSFYDIYYPNRFQKKSQRIYIRKYFQYILLLRLNCILLIAQSWYYIRCFFHAYRRTIRYTDVYVHTHVVKHDKLQIDETNRHSSTVSKKYIYMWCPTGYYLCTRHEQIPILFFLQQTLSKKFSFKIFHCDFNVQTGQKRISYMLVSNQDFEIL